MSSSLFSNLGCNVLAVGVSYAAAMFAFIYSSEHKVCDENVFISSTVGAVASIVSAVAYTAIVVCARKEALPIRWLTITSEVMAWSAAALYVASDVIICDCVFFGGNNENTEGVDPYQSAMKLQVISASIMSCVMGLMSLVGICGYIVMDSFNGRRGSKQSLPMIV